MISCKCMIFLFIIAHADSADSAASAAYSASFSFFLWAFYFVIAAL